MKKRYIVLFTVFAILVIIYGIVSSFNDHTYTCTVTGKDRVFSSNFKSHHDLIYCKDDKGNTYEFRAYNNLLRLKFNASDDFANIEEGATYTFTVTGFHVGILSIYENVLSFQKIE